MVRAARQRGVLWPAASANAPRAARTHGTAAWRRKPRALSQRERLREKVQQHTGAAQLGAELVLGTTPGCGRAVVPQALARHMQQHQVEGTQFMFDNAVRPIERNIAM